MTLFFFSPQFINAQCSGTVTLSTQTQVNAFTCTSFTGTLIIEDDNDGIDNITTMNPIWTNGMNTPASIITEDLIVRNNDNLINLDGLDGIKEVQRDYIVENNAVINGNTFTQDITSVGRDLIIRNNPNLTVINIWYNITAIGRAFVLENNASLTAVQGFTGLTSVGGGFRVIDNPSLANLNIFFSDLQLIAGGLFILNNDALVTWPGLPNATDIGFMRIENNDNLRVLQGFGSLTSLNSGSSILWIRNNDSLTDIIDFDNLTSINGAGSSIFIANNPALVNINDFTALSSIGTIDIASNISLASLPTFPSISILTGNLIMKNNLTISSWPDYNNLLSVDGFIDLGQGSASMLSGFSGLTSVGGDFKLRNMNSLTVVTAFANVSAIGGSFTLTNNPVLSDCCWAVPLIDVTAGTINITGNATGCESPAAIGGDIPMISCPADQSVQFMATPNGGTAQVTITHPTPTDDCGVQTTSLVITDPNGIIQNDNYVAGTQETFNVDLLGNWTFEYSATDDINQTGSCTMMVTVNDPICAGATLTTQAGVDAYFTNLSCQTMNGNLIINDDGTDPITSLSVISNAGLTSITGTLSILNCTSLTSLSGLEGITDVGTNLVVNNAPLLTDFAGLEDIVTVGGDFSINSTGAIDIPSFNNLQSVGSRLRILDNLSLLDVSGFNTITSTGSLQFIGNTACQDISGFQSLSTVGGILQISNHFTMPGVTGFGAITSVVGNMNVSATPMVGGFPFFGPSYSIVGNLRINSCNQIDDISNFANISSIGGDLDIASNSELAICCIILDMDMNVVIQGNIIISNNRAGCDSYAEIGAQAPQVLAPSNFSVNASPGTCVGTVTLADPAATDDCGIINYTLDLVDANGLILVNGANAVAGNTQTFTLPVGVNSYSYTASDENGNVTTAQTLVTVVDNEAPSWTDTDNTTTVIGEAGVDNAQALFNANMGTATDACSAVTTSLISTVVNPLCGASSETTFTMTATDAAGNVSVPYTVIIILEDTAPPVFSGVPADATIFCNDVIPTPPVVTAIDQGVGDISANIVLTQSSISGNCTTGTPQEEITYTYTIDDGCGNISTTTWKLTIQNDFVVDLGADINLCDQFSYTLDAGPGNTYAWSTGETTQTITVFNTDIYTVDVMSNNGCCESDDILVWFDSTPDVSATGATLDCSGNPVQIMGNSTVVSVSIFYAWSGPGGFTSFVQNPIVTTAGIYTLTVSNINGCTATATAEVLTNTNVPDLVATGGAIGCTNTSVQLMSNSTVTGVTYDWSGPGGFSSSMQNPTVTDAGTYTVSITAPNGCIATADAVVTSNTGAPDIAASGGAIDCTNTSVQLMSNSTVAGVTYAWSGPGGFSSTIQNPTATDAGTYTVTTMAPNGCSATADAIVTVNVTTPDAVASGGTIDCANTSVQLMSNSTVAGVTYAWSGPGGFNATMPDPTVTDVGTYTVIVTAPNGCSATADAIVTATDDVPELSATGGTITCTNAAVELMSSTMTAGVSYIWSGPGGFSSTMPNPTATEAGMYTVMITAPNGCIARVTVEVIEDTSLPTAAASASMITCGQMTSQIMTDASTDATTFAWSGPNGFISTDKDPTVSEAGMYTLLVTSANGCTAMTTVSVNEDIAIPDATAQGATIDCTTSQVALMGNSTTAGVTYAWVGPNGFTSDEQNPEVSEEGMYTLTVTGLNECSSTATTEVSSTGDLPQLSGTGGTLDCNNNGELQLTGSSMTADVTLSWSGPGGFSSNEDNPTVTTAGIYTLTGVTAAGCTDTQEVVVVDDTMAPEVSLSLGAADCQAGTRLIIATSNMTGVDVSWTGPDGFSSNELSPSITLAGTYTLETFPANGCNSTHTITVADDVSYTQTIETVDIMGATTSGSASIIITGGTGPFTIEWDNGETGMMATDLTAGDHTVTVIDGLGCSQTFSFFIDNSTSTFEEEWKNDIKLFPNPASDILNIQLSESVDYFKAVTLYDINGRLIETITLDPTKKNVSINVSAWNAGIYLARVHAASSSHAVRFIVD